MSLNFKRISCIALLTCLLPASLMAATPLIYPELVPVSGILTDAEGQPLKDFHKVELRVFSGERGGESLYFERFDIEGSRLDVALGEKRISGMPSLTDLVLNADALYLEVVIDDEVQRPRLQLGAVPYALHAELATHANTAERATSADLATECGDAATVGGKAASEFLPSTYSPPTPTWSQLADKPSFAVNGPLNLDAQNGSYLFSLAPCATPGHTLSWTGSVWACRPLPTPLTGSFTIQIANNIVELAEDSVDSIYLVNNAVTNEKLANNAVSTSKLEDAAVTSDKIANSAVGNQHIGAGTLLPNKISGGAVTLLSLTAQNIMNTLTIAQGVVTVFGEFKAGSYKTVSPVRRTYQIWADQFRPVSQANAPVHELTADNHLYLASAPVGSGAPYILTLLASIPSLPSDSELDQLTCFYINGNGSLANTSFKLVTTGASTTAIVRREDTAILGTGAISGNIRSASTVASANNRSITDRRLHIEAKLQTTILGTWNRFLGCQVEVLTSQPF
jgi:hypothetical protein